MLHLYNTLSREIELFKPLDSSGTVKVYCCGPTVYNYIHIGNLRAYLFEDFVIRSLRFLGYRLDVTMNITDIDDKTIRDSVAQSIPLLEFTEKYTQAFLEDMADVRIDPPTRIIPISTLVDEMIDMINVLIKKWYAYLSDDGSVYYSISKFKSYGELAHLDKKGMISSVRIDNDEYDKDHAADFVLWKAYDPIKDGPNKWTGIFMIDEKEVTLEGRPGWHIECSACNLKYFGAQIDIHMGGVDNIFPHHQNEIAQSEAYTGKQFSRYWIHGGHLQVEGKKMAKSAGNFYTLRDLYAKFPDTPKLQIARAFRLMAFGVNYRENFNFSFASLESALRTLDGWDELFRRIAREPKIEGTVRKDFREFLQGAMVEFVYEIEQDFATPEALARIHEMVGDIHSILDAGQITTAEALALQDLFRSFDSVLALFDFTLFSPEEIPAEILALAEDRIQAKLSKDFARSDSIRWEIESRGYRIVDSKDGSTVEKIS